MPPDVRWGDQNSRQCPAAVPAKALDGEAGRAYLDRDRVPDVQSHRQAVEARTQVGGGGGHPYRNALPHGLRL